MTLRWNRGQNKLTAPCSYKVESVRKDVVRQDTKDDIATLGSILDSQLS